ncbi:hypothetical protein Hanom_Chr05g00399081 [Helianthus anomalus]
MSSGSWCCQYRCTSSSETFDTDDSDLSTTVFPSVVVPKLPKLEDASEAPTAAEGDLKANGTNSAASGFKRIVFPVELSFLSMAEDTLLDKLILLQAQKTNMNLKKYIITLQKVNLQVADSFTQILQNTYLISYFTHTNMVSDR